jgi:DNA-binding beta-propeller fold protein YncE
MKRELSIGATFAVVLIALGIGSVVFEKKAAVEAAGVQAPRFEVDPLWPKPLPNHWVLGNVIGVATDAQDHIWIIHRQASLEPMENYAAANPPGPKRRPGVVEADCCAPAPPVLEFDQAGTLINSWGGPGEGYDWPETNHGIFVDYKGNVWIGGNGRPRPGKAASASGGAPPESQNTPPGYYNDNMVLEFTQSGKFLMQIGKPGQSKGSNDLENLKGPAKLYVDPKTDELYVADGYGNHRVIVFDASTGKYKRHWGAYGHKPDDTPLGLYQPNDPPAQQFRNPVHCAQLSNDNLLYVCDRVNDRIQVFKPDGTFVKEQILYKDTLGDGSVWDIAFSRDPQQKYIYLADGANEKVHILDRESLQVLTSFGDGGRQPGEFYAVHSIASDSKGNIYTTETYRGQRVQRFLYKGLAMVTKQDQGVVWPRGSK